jgi:hypothetical protein
VAPLARAVATVMGDAAVQARLAKLDIMPDVYGAALQTKTGEIRNWTCFIDAKESGRMSGGYDFVVNGVFVHVETDGTKPLLAAR